MAVARRRTEGEHIRENVVTSRSQDNETDAQGHEAAIQRLREIAENGLDDPALDGLDDIEPVAVAAAVNGKADAAPVGEVAREHVRIVEAMIFAAPQPVSEKKLAEQLPADIDVRALLEQLQSEYETRGVHLIRVAGKWAFRTADDLSYLLEKYATEERRLSKAALETLSIIAYHQPVTRSEIEEIRGVQTSRGTLDVLMETSWIRPRGRRRAPGKPLTYGTTEEFLSHFGLDALGDLPGLAELKGAGLLDSQLPPDFAVPNPINVAALMPDELPLEDDEEPEELALDDPDMIDGEDEVDGTVVSSADDRQSS
ncbi:MAG: segregation and condensation protein B [Alphaproteobacteria bacterium]|jgi:segregation and condensation protein B